MTSNAKKLPLGTGAKAVGPKAGKKGAKAQGCVGVRGSGPYEFHGLGLRTEGRRAEGPRYMQPTASRVKYETAGVKEWRGLSPAKAGDGRRASPARAEGRVGQKPGKTQSGNSRVGVKDGLKGVRFEAHEEGGPVLWEPETEGSDGTGRSTMSSRRELLATWEMNPLHVDPQPAVENIPHPQLVPFHKDGSAPKGLHLNYDDFEKAMRAAFGLLAKRSAESAGDQGAELCEDRMRCLFEELDQDEDGVVCADDLIEIFLRCGDDNSPNGATETSASNIQQSSTPNLWPPHHIRVTATNQVKKKKGKPAKANRDTDQPPPQFLPSTNPSNDLMGENSGRHMLEDCMDRLHVMINSINADSAAGSKPMQVLPNAEQLERTGGHGPGQDELLLKGADLPDGRKLFSWDEAMGFRALENGGLGEPTESEAPNPWDAALTLKGIEEAITANVGKLPSIGEEEKSPTSGKSSARSAPAAQHSSQIDSSVHCSAEAWGESRRSPMTERRKGMLDQLVEEWEKEKGSLPSNAELAIQEVSTPAPVAVAESRKTPPRRRNSKDASPSKTRGRDASPRSPMGSSDSAQRGRRGSGKFDGKRGHTNSPQRKGSRGSSSELLGQSPSRHLHSQIRETSVRGHPVVRSGEAPKVVAQPRGPARGLGAQHRGENGHVPASEAEMKSRGKASYMKGHFDDHVITALRDTHDQSISLLQAELVDMINRARQLRAHQMESIKVV